MKTLGKFPDWLTAPPLSPTPARAGRRLLRRPAAAQFPIEALGKLRPAAEAVPMLTRAPLALAAQSVLAAATLSAQAHADVKLPHGSVHPIANYFEPSEIGSRATSTAAP